MKSARAWRALAALAVAAIFVAAAYRIGQMALAENFAELDPSTGLLHLPEHPLVLRARAEQLRSGKLERGAAVERLLRMSLRRDPVDGRSYGLLGLEAAGQGRDADAQRLLDIGIRRAPRDFELRRAAMSQSLRRNDLESATRHVVAMLQVEPTRAHHVVEWLWFIYTASPRGQSAVERSALEPSEWRDAFLRHVTTYARNPAEVLRLVGLMRERGTPATPAERERIQQTLQQRRAWSTAFAFWMQGQELVGVRRFPNVFNGDFERPFLEDRAFDWQSLDPSGAVVGIDAGPDGNRSLRVQFLGNPTTDVLARHTLLLGKGQYDWRVRVRFEQLESERGPVLVLTCLGSRQSRPLAILDFGPAEGVTAPWRSVSAQLEIPGQDCAAQQLELLLEVLPRVRGSARGTLWLDDVTLVRR